MNDKQNTLQNQTEEKPKITEPSLEIPKEIKQDGWKMPEPVFRCSSGKTPQSFDKRKSDGSSNSDGQALNENPLYDVNDVAGRTMAFINLSDLQREDSEKSDSAPAIQPQPNISEEFSAPQAVQAKRRVEEAPKRDGFKWLLLLGGLFLFFALVLAAAFGVYYFYFRSL
jgi:hypothetical protein